MTIHDGAQELSDFMTVSFTREELERIAFRLDPNGRLAAALPGPTATWSYVAHQFVVALLARGLLDEPLFSILFDERPRKSGQIQDIMCKCLAPHELGPPPLSSDYHASLRSSGALPVYQERPGLQNTQLPWWATVAVLSGLTLGIGSGLVKYYSSDESRPPAQMEALLAAAPEEAKAVVEDGPVKQGSLPARFEGRAEDITDGAAVPFGAESSKIQVHVESTPVGILSIDGVVRGKTPLGVGVPSGRHRFIVTAQNCRSREEQVDLDAEGQKRFQWTLKCEPRSTRQGGQAIVDGDEPDPEMDGVSTLLTREASIDAPIHDDLSPAP